MSSLDPVRCRPPHPAPDAANVAKRFCELVAIDLNDRDALEGAPDGRIVEATLGLRRATIADPVAELGEEDAHVAVPFMPVHGTADLPEPAIAAVAAGAAAGVDLLVGTTRDEAKAFMFGRPPGEVPAQYVTLALSRGRDPEELAGAYRAVLGERVAMELGGTLSTDGFSTLPAIRLAEAHQPPSPHVDVPVRLAEPALRRVPRRLPRARHRLHISAPHRLPDNFLAGPNAPDERSADMRAAWVAFAATGEPNHPGVL